MKFTIESYIERLKSEIKELKSDPNLANEYHFDY